MSFGSRRLSLAVALVAVLAAGAVVAIVSSGGGRTANGDPAAASGGSLAARFTALSGAHSNSCSLQAPQVMRMPKDARLQGACCFPMNEASYKRQIHGLHDYSLRKLVPSDPYDVSVALAKRLISYRDIPLTSTEQAAYTLAIH